MFRVKKISQSNRTIRMPDDLIERLNKIAEENGISFNRLVEQCCEYALSKMEEDAEQQDE